MKKLAISFVTYKRSNYIKADLAVIAQPTKEYDIDIYIYDGSPDMRTEKVVKQYIEKGYEHIHYFHTDKQVSVTDSMLQRVNAALLEPDAEYVWFCSDNYVMLPKYYSEILSYIEQSYDIITICDYALKGTKKFNKASKLVDYALVPMTKYGATIIKKKLIESFDVREASKECPSLSVQLAYLRAIADIEEFRGVVIDAGQNAIVVHRHKVYSNCYGDMWNTWVVHWYRFINLLPPAYDDIREGLYNRQDLQLGIFALGQLLRQRYEGQFDWKDYWKCRKYVKKIIIMPRVFVFGISLLPRSIAKLFLDVVIFFQSIRLTKMV